MAEQGDKNKREPDPIPLEPEGESAEESLASNATPGAAASDSEDGKSRRRENESVHSTKGKAAGDTVVAARGPGLSVYKAGQGFYTRMGTVIFVSLVAMLGILWAWEYLKGIRISGVNELYVAAAGAILLGGVITFFTYLDVFVKPKSVDFLIATEGEMKKVNWSTRREVIGSTTAVITTAFVLTVFCYVIDIAFVALFQAMRVLDS